MAHHAVPLFAIALAGLCGLLVPQRACAEAAAPTVAPAALPAAAKAPSSAPRVHLSWVRDAEAAEACPDASQVQADVVSRLGFSPFVAGDTTSASIEVLVTRNKSLWQAGAVMRDADGTLRGNRRVESAAPDCHSLAAAAALAIALMIDPDVILYPTPPRAVTPPPATTVTPPPPVQSASPPRRGLHGALSVGAMLASGLLPELALGPLLRGEVELRRRLAVVVSAQFFPEQRWVQSGADAKLGLALGSVGPCYRVELGEHWAVASCGSFLLGSLGLTVASPEPVQAGAKPWFGLSCGLRLNLRAGAFELGLGGDALAHLGRRNYTVSRQAPVRTESLFTEPAAGVLGSLTTGVRF